MIGFILKKTEMSEKTEDRITLETWIRDDYKKVQNYLRWNPWVEWFMDSLITMEDDIRAYLRETLKTKKYGEYPEKTNVFEKYMKGWKDRQYLETLVLNKVIWKKTSIDDLLDNWRARVRELFSTNEALDTALKKWLIQNIEIKNVILPPDPKDLPEIWSGAWFEKKELEQDKFLLFMDMLRNLKIYDDDILIIHSGILKKDMMRENTYHAIYIPRINKTVFLNVWYGEASFVCDGEVSLEVMTTYWKEKLQTELWAIKIIFSEKNTQWWKNSFKNALLWEWWKVWEKVSKEKIKEIRKEINKEIKQRIIRKIYQDNESEIQQHFISSTTYRERTKNLKWEDKEKFGVFPISFDWLIWLLWWDIDCRQWEYVKTLLESRQAGEEYFKARKENKENKLTLEEFKKIYQDNESEIQQHFISSTAYTERIENLKWEDLKKFGRFPPGFGWLIWLLWWNTGCRQWEYVKALLESRQAGEEYFKARKKNKEGKEKYKLTWYDARAMYAKYYEEIQKYFIGEGTYKKRIENLKQTDRFKNLNEEEQKIFRWFPHSFATLDCYDEMQNV